MGELKIAKLHFRSALHLGADMSGIGLEESQLIAHSDTLFSCLINSYAQLHSGDSGAVERLLDPFRKGEPPFRISSAFPFQMRSGHATTYFLPRPLIDPPGFYDPRHGRRQKQDYGKLVRDTQLVPIDTFKKWLGHGGTRTRIAKVELENANNHIGRFCTQEIRPHHARDRLTNAPTIYHTGLVHFFGESGLYFLVELNNGSLIDEDAFQAILRQAGMNGLGGRRSLGNGVFNVRNNNISDLDPTWEDLFALPAQNGFINLSLYLPDAGSLNNLAPVAYQLVPRQGWCYSSVAPTQMKRKKVTMFSEGSVFCNNPKGAFVDVTPDEFTAHKLYRYGIPISLPIKVLEADDDIS